MPLTAEKRRLAAKEEQDKAILDYVQKAYDAAADARRPYERTWYRNIAFFVGEQWVMWNKYANRLDTPSPGEAGVPNCPVVWNYFRPFTLSRHAKETRSTPQGEVQPATNEDEDVNAA
jgi:hypothetical protein